MWPWRKRRRPTLPDDVARPRYGRPGWSDPRSPSGHLDYKIRFLAWLLPDAQDPLRRWLAAHPENFNCSVLYFIEARGSRAARAALPDPAGPEFLKPTRNLYLYVLPTHERLRGVQVNCACDFGSPASPHGIYAGRGFAIRTGEGVCEVRLWG